MDSKLNKSVRTIEMRGISKSFPGVQALDRVDFSIQSGRVHALVGENGAGKTTLMNILGGVLKPDIGVISLDSKDIEIISPHRAQEIGISFIHQELSLVPDLNVSQNIFLGREVSGRLRGFLKSDFMEKRSKEILARLGLDLDVRRLIKDLNAGEQQLVEIAKALNSEAWVIIMDEPTSALTEAEKNQLFEIIRQLKHQGIAVVYITHRMPEIFEITDEVTILRDGKHMATFIIENTNERDVIKMMIGRDVGSFFFRGRANVGETVLEVRNLTRKSLFKDVSFEVSEGEVLGLYGLRGSGRTEVARGIFGLDRYDSGEILFSGRELNVKNPLEAIDTGIGFVSEDRHKEGLIELMSVKENLCQPSLPWINRFGWIEKKRENDITKEYVSSLDIKVTSFEQVINTLSGGNQQKVSLGKWLARNPKLLILDEPTKGIDVGAKAEIYRIIESLVEEKIAILMISSELPEIIGISDRVLVFHKGEVVAHYRHDEISEEKLLLSASGVNSIGEKEEIELETKG